MKLFSNKKTKEINKGQDNIETIEHNIEQNKVNLIDVLEIQINLHEENVKKLKQMKEKLSPTLVAIDLVKKNNNYTNIALILIGIIAVISSIISIRLLFNFNKKKK